MSNTIEPYDEVECPFPQRPFKFDDITQQHIDKLNATIDAGLCSGLGVQEPGKMCVEAAVCYALGLPHSDDPPVSRALRTLKLRLNDGPWSSNAARAAGLRKLAIAQLGSAGVIDDIVFVRRLVEQTVRLVVPRAFRLVAKIVAEPIAASLEKAAIRCETDGNIAAAYAVADAVADAAADAVANAAYAAARAAARAADAAAAAANAAARAAANAATYATYAAADAAADAATYATNAARAAANAATYAAADAAANAARAADAATYATNAAARAAADAAANVADAARAADAELTFFANIVLDVLTELNAPGIKWLANE